MDWAASWDSFQLGNNCSYFVGVKDASIHGTTSELMTAFIFFLPSGPRPCSTGTYFQEELNENLVLNQRMSGKSRELAAQLHLNSRHPCGVSQASGCAGAGQSAQNTGNFLLHMFMHYVSSLLLLENTCKCDVVWPVMYSPANPLRSCSLWEGI